MVSDSAIAQYLEDNPMPTNEYQHRISLPLPDFDLDPAFNNITFKIKGFGEGEYPQYHGIYLAPTMHGI
jgi:hypothetical protein